MDPSNESIKATDLYAGLTLTRLQAFVAVADHGGFSAAAVYLALGQARRVPRTAGAPDTGRR